VRGTVIAAGTQQPVAGSVVTAQTAAGATLRRTITNDRGQFAFDVPDSATQLRVLHIGFAPRLVPLPHPREGVLQLNVSMSRLQTLLDPIEVRDNSNCSPRKDRAAALALYEHVRQGLLATIVAREAAPAQLTILRFQRFFDAAGERIVNQEVQRDSIASSSRPFQPVRSAREFVEQGFARNTEDGQLFFAPDADVLLDEAFRRGYCLRINSDDASRRGQVGLAFAAAKHIAGHVDIDGAIWVDTVARALRSIEYRYVGLDAKREALKPGGRIEFREMPNGSVLIDRWSLRLVGAPTTAVQRVGAGRVERTVYDVQETGGELAGAQWADGSRWHAALGTLRVVARTSANTPASHARIVLEHTSFAGATDTTGTVVFSDLLPGPYRPLVVDSMLSTIDISLDPKVPFVAQRDSVYVAPFVVPTALDYANTQCQPAPSASTFVRYNPDHGTRESVLRQRDRGVALFVYATTPDGTPASQLRITEALAANDREPAWHDTATGGMTDNGGRYRSCWNYHVGETVQIWVRPAGQPPQLTLVPLTQRVHATRIIVPLPRN
jgi:hypothetical protein